VLFAFNPGGTPSGRYHCLLRTSHKKQMRFLQPAVLPCLRAADHFYISPTPEGCQGWSESPAGLAAHSMPS
jgi:hypothetical protein